MNLALFPTSYEPAFETSWRLYRSRAESKTAMSKAEGAAAWSKQRKYLPDLPILLSCISLYLDQLESTKRVRNNGRDTSTEYTFKKHFATFLNKQIWRDFYEQATASLALSQIPATEAQERPQARSFKAIDYFTPERTTPLRPASQILAERRERDRQNNSPTPIDTIEPICNSQTYEKAPLL